MVTPKHQKPINIICVMVMLFLAVILLPASARNSANKTDSRNRASTSSAKINTTRNQRSFLSSSGRINQSNRSISKTSSSNIVRRESTINRTGLTFGSRTNKTNILSGRANNPGAGTSSVNIRKSTVISRPEPGRNTGSSRAELTKSNKDSSRSSTMSYRITRRSSADSEKRLSLSEPASKETKTPAAPKDKTAVENHRLYSSKDKVSNIGSARNNGREQIKTRTSHRGFYDKITDKKTRNEPGPTSIERFRGIGSRDTESKRFERHVRDMRNHRDPVVNRKTDRGTALHRPRETKRIIYEDRENFRRHHRHEHVYRDRHDHLRFRIIWPGFSCGIFYDWGPYFRFSWVYPYYHRRYVFVSLGGYWPVDYRYMRYYWYPCHEYYWYGYDPIARQISGDTCNYYTYNYYYDTGNTADDDYSSVNSAVGSAGTTTCPDVSSLPPPPPPQEPLPVTSADDYFDEGVKVFEDGDYSAAADKFAQAMALAPEDMVLPFAYAQALFADGKYEAAAQVIRSITEKVSPEKEGIYYPRGLYADDDTLNEQIDHLTRRAQTFSSQADVQLLLGYQLLGLGRIKESIEVLRQASLAPQNTAAAAVLLDLAEKINAANDDQDSD